MPVEFRDTAGSSCGALLPSGNAVDEIEGVRCTLIDNGMPCIVFKAEDVGATGYETRDELESDAFADLRTRIEAIRLAAGPLMNLGDVKDKSVPKMMLVAPPVNGGAVTVRSFIPHRAHATIGVLGAAEWRPPAWSKLARCRSGASPRGQPKTLSVEQPDRRDELRLKLTKMAMWSARRCCAHGSQADDGVVFA